MKMNKRAWAAGVLAMGAAIPGLAVASASGVTQLDNVATKLQSFLTSNWVITICVGVFIGGLLTLLSGHEIGPILQLTMKVGIVLALIVGAGSLISAFGISGAVI